jgi:hypothetical protein
MNKYPRHINQRYDIFSALDDTRFAAYLEKQVLLGPFQAADPLKYPAAKLLGASGVLERLMRYAIREFASCSDAGRQRRFLSSWLLNFRTYLDLRVPREDHDLYLAPISFLLDTLRELEKGNVREVLKPAKISNRPISDEQEIRFRVTCVLLADELYKKQRDAGERLSYARADDAVYRRVRSSKTAKEVKMSARTLAGWRRSIKAASAPPYLREAHEIALEALTISRKIYTRDESIEKLFYSLVSPQATFF